MINIVFQFIMLVVLMIFKKFDIHTHIYSFYPTQVIISEMKKKTASTIICENFKIHQQTIFQDYKCGFKSGLTYFGRLYIGQDHVLFIANMFGILKTCVIQIENIKKVEQPSKNCLFIEQQQNGSKIQYLFNGFKSDHAFILVRALWKKQKIQSQVLNSHEEDESHNSDLGQISKDKLIDEGNVQSSFFNTKTLQAEKQKLCEFQLPCSVEQYYTFFLADNAKVYPRSKHLQARNSKEIVITPWKESVQLQSQIKQINAIIKVSGVPFLSQAHLSQVWKLKKNQNQQIFMDVVTQMSDVPYSNYFVVNTFLSILKDGETKCKMIVQTSIVFNKSTYMKNKILGKTIIDLKEDFQVWFENVKQILTGMRKSQQIDLKTSRKSSGEIEYETNVPIIGSQRYISSPKRLITHHTIDNHHPAAQAPETTLIKKIDNLTKLVIILIILVLLQSLSIVIVSNRQLSCRQFDTMLQTNLTMKQNQIQSNQLEIQNDEKQHLNNIPKSQHNRVKKIINLEQKQYNNQTELNQ